MDLEFDNLFISSNHTTANKFKTKVQGIVIQDSFNNPFFPIKFPIIDKGFGYIDKIFKQYFLIYQKQYNSNILPWHYVIELRDSGYIIYNTRPIDMKFPININSLIEYFKDHPDDFNENSKELLLSGKDIGNMIHICIIGNSNIDVYEIDLYKKIGENIIAPFSKIYKFNPMVNQGFYFLETGKKLNTQLFIRFSNRI